jgi:hypothetical protein
MSKRAKRKRQQREIFNPDNPSEVEALDEESAFIQMEPGASALPPISFESVVTTAKYFAHGAGQDIEIRGEAIHVPGPGLNHTKVRNITIGKLHDGCTACQQIAAQLAEWRRERKN